MTTLLFAKPEGTENKSFHQAINKKLIDRTGIEKIVVCIYLNIERDTESHFVIGLKAKGSFEEQAEKVKKALYTQFYKRVYFEFVDLGMEKELEQTLEKQGEILLDIKAGIA